MMQPGLGGGVRGRSRRRPPAADAADHGDDAAGLLLLHDGIRPLRDVQRRQQVEIKHLRAEGRARGRGRPGRTAAGVVDHAVEPTESFDRGVDQRECRLRVTNVSHKEGRLAPVDARQRLRLVPGAHHDVGTCGQERTGDPQPDAAHAAGHQRDVPVRSRADRGSVTGWYVSAPSKRLGSCGGARMGVEVHRQGRWPRCRRLSPGECIAGRRMVRACGCADGRRPGFIGPRRRASRGGPGLQRRRRHQGDAATEGFDALIGANRGCTPRSPRSMTARSGGRRGPRLLPRRRHRPGRQRRRHRRQRRRDLRAARGGPRRARRRDPPVAAGAAAPDAAHGLHLAHGDRAGAARRTARSSRSCRASSCAMPPWRLRGRSRPRTRTSSGWRRSRSTASTRSTSAAATASSRASPSSSTCPAGRTTHRDAFVGKAWGQRRRTEGVAVSNEQDPLDSPTSSARSRAA